MDSIFDMFLSLGVFLGLGWVLALGADWLGKQAGLWVEEDLVGWRNNVRVSVMLVACFGGPILTLTYVCNTWSCP